MDVAWSNSRVVPDLEEIRKLKEHAGKNIYVVGGALLVSSMINIGLIDDIRLIVNPVLLGGGKPVFGSVTDRRYLRLLSVEPRDHDRLSMIYATDRSLDRVAQTECANQEQRRLVVPGAQIQLTQGREPNRSIEASGSVVPVRDVLGDGGSKREDGDEPDAPRGQVGGCVLDHRTSDATPTMLGVHGHPRDLNALGRVSLEREEADDPLVDRRDEPFLAPNGLRARGDAALVPEVIRQAGDDRVTCCGVLDGQPSKDGSRFLHGIGSGSDRVIDR